MRDAVVPNSDYLSEGKSSEKFDSVRYQACGLYTNADKAYYDGFIAGYMHVGNMKLICEPVLATEDVFAGKDKALLQESSKTKL